MNTELLAVAYGGGTNSTALLCGLYDRGIKPDLILFADTGAEMPHTHAYVEIMRAKVREWWGMDIEIVRQLRRDKSFEGLELECVRLRHLPALAFGRRSCSIKFKHKPQEKRIKKMMRERGVSVVTRAIGFDANEAHRLKPSPDAWAINWYPLVDWQWGREECVASICHHGLPQPGKSSCYFCPGMKKREVLKLREEHPDLLAKALWIEEEAQATLRTARGLGGAKNRWSDWLANHDAQGRMDADWIEPAHIPCGCYDG